jgi:hypothetical protein
VRPTRPGCPRRLLLRAWSLAGCLSLVLVAACTSPDATQTKVKAPTTGERDTDIKHEPCDKGSSSAQKVDVNGDGLPDIVHVMKGGREVCRVVDLNLDGADDAFIYYDAQGREIRRESDFDRDGRADEIALYKDGVIALKERETNFDNKIDTWDHYEGGRLARRERDSDGDKIIDQWWTFGDPTRPKCAVVATDQNTDGKPDPSSVVDLCGESYSGRSRRPARPRRRAPAPGAAATPPRLPRDRRPAPRRPAVGRARTARTAGTGARARCPGEEGTLR